MFIMTRRLVLRPLEERDFADFCAYATSRDMCRMMGNTPMDTEEEARETFDYLAYTASRCYGIVTRWEDRLIGNLSIGNPVEEVRNLPETQGKRGCSLSFCPHPKYQRQGLMEEVLRALLDALFREGYEYVNCGQFDFNKPSEALQRKLGFTPCATFQTEMEGEVLTGTENILWNPRTQSE